jgi:hypothetical protein
VTNAFAAATPTNQLGVPMARQMRGPRKQRTRQHVIADQCVHHVEGFVLDAGHTVQSVESDYGYDLLLFTYDENGYLEPDLAYLQLKAAESLQAIGSAYVFDLDIRDYNLWMLDNLPVILILFDAGRKRAYWVAIQEYFRKDDNRQPKRGAKTVRVYVPKRQVFHRRAVEKIRDLKCRTLTAAKGKVT